MAMLPNVFVADDVVDDNAIIATGWYEAEITKSMLKETKAKDGKFLSLGFRIINGPSEGRMIWTNLNLINKNPIAVQIAQRNLASICKAVGKDSIEDSTELHGVPIGIMIDVQTGDAKYPDRNNVTNYCAISDIPEESPFE